MRLRVLGSIQVEDLAGPVHLGGPKERSVMALLAVHAGELVSEDRLIDALWPEGPPRTAPRTLQAYISRLRGALGRDGGTVELESGPGGYTLRVGPGASDAIEVERLAEEARTASAAGDHAGAAELLRRALAEWTGRSFGEFADEPWAVAEANRLDGLRRVLQEQRIEAELACGRHAVLVGELEALCRADPFRERFWAQRMIALYRSGRQADALAVGREIRRRLADELGVDPGQELQALERAILTQDPQLDLDRADGGEDRATIAFPGGLAFAGPADFVGRGDKLAVLHECWKAACDGNWRAVFVGGEPGIGKSRLVGEFARGIHDAGATVLFGTSEEDLDVAYQPFAEALRPYVAGCSDDVLRAHVRRHGGDIARLIPEAAVRLPEFPSPMSADPEAERYRLFDAVAALLASAAEETPLLLVIDDLQWANKATLMMLRHLLRPTPVPLMIVCLFRDTETSNALSDLLADLRGSSHVTRISVDGLDLAGVTAYLEGAAGEELNEPGREFALRLWEETDGSPFFVGEVIRHLVETGSVMREGDRWRSVLAADQLALPASIREVVARRVGRLPSATRDALSLASVIGPTFTLALLEASSGLSGDALLNALEEAMVAGMVRDVPGSLGTYAFAHALVRQALHEDLSVLRRARLHRRVAEALEASDDAAKYVAEIAMHYLAAAADGVASKAVTYAARAAAKAIDRVAYEEALRFYERAVEVAEWAGFTYTAQFCDLMLGLADAHWRVGDVIPSREAYTRAADLARELGDARRLTLAALRTDADLGGYCHSTRTDEQLVELLEESLRVIGNDEPALKSRLLARLAVELFYVTHTIDRRAELADEAVRLAEQTGDLRVILFARRCQLWAARRPEEPLDLYLRSAMDIIELSERIGAIETAYEARFFRLTVFLEAGDFAGADAEAAEGTKLSERLGVPGFLPWIAAYASVRAWIAGKLDDAERLNAEALDEAFKRRADPELVFTLIGGQAFVNQYLRGMDEAIAGLEAMAEAHRDEPSFDGGLTIAYRMADRREDCRRVFERHAVARFARLERNTTWLLNFSLQAHACAYLDDTGHATLCYDELLPFADRWASGVMLTFGPVSWALARLATTLGWYEVAEMHFADAFRRVDSVPAPIFRAELRYHYATMLARRGGVDDLDRARELVAGSLEVANELDLPMLRTWTQELRDELDR